MDNKYIIIDKDCYATICRAENAKRAVCEYAEQCWLKIDSTIFKKVVQSLSFDEIIELFNQTCLDEGCRIEKVFIGDVALYDETDDADRR